MPFGQPSIIELPRTANPSIMFPPGEKSWCKWQRAQAKQEPYCHPNPLPEEGLAAINPIYSELTDLKLLERCVGGLTRNKKRKFQFYSVENRPLSKIFWSHNCGNCYLYSYRYFQPWLQHSHGYPRTPGSNCRPKLPSVRPNEG